MPSSVSRSARFLSVAALVSLAVMTSDASATPRAALPENIVEGSTGGGASSPDTPSESCVIYQTRRGPGGHSRWREGVDWPYYNAWYVWIPMPAPKDDMFFEATAPDYFRSESGYVPTAAADITKSVLGGNYDPCNRCEGASCTTCGSYLKPMPVDFEYPSGSGKVWKLMDRPYAEGGRCGSSECPCYVSGVVSPLVLDFGAAGLKYTQDGEHISFDLGEGNAPTSWISNGDAVAFLVVDLKSDGVISSINEMFGDKTKGPDQKQASDGFAALAKYDTNHDQLIDSKDKVFPLLSLWFDANADGKSESAELQTLAARKITSISLKTRDLIANKDAYGNSTRGVSDATLDSGGSVPVYDVWFAPVNPLSLRTNPGGKSSLSALPSKGSPQYDALRTDWKATLEAEGFGEGEMGFERGKLRSRIDETGRTVGHIATWPHAFDHCNVIVEYDADWKKQKSYSSCS